MTDNKDAIIAELVKAAEALLDDYIAVTFIDFNIEVEAEVIAMRAAIKRARGEK